MNRLYSSEMVNTLFKLVGLCQSEMIHATLYHDVVHATLYQGYTILCCAHAQASTKTTLGTFECFSTLSLDGFETLFIVDCWIDPFHVGFPCCLVGFPNFPFWFTPYFFFVHLGYAPCRLFIRLTPFIFTLIYPKEKHHYVSNGSP